MAYTTPRDWTDGELVTATIMNTHVRDNINYLAMPPRCRVYSAGAVTISTAGPGTALPLDSENYDSDGMHDTVTNNSRITFPVAGVYQLTANVQWESNATGVRTIWFVLNGITNIGVSQNAPVAAVALAQVLQLPYEFAVNDYVELLVYQTSGVDLDVIVSSFAPFAAAHYVGVST